MYRVYLSFDSTIKSLYSTLVLGCVRSAVSPFNVVLLSPLLNYISPKFAPVVAFHLLRLSIAIRIYCLD